MGPTHMTAPSPSKRARVDQGGDATSSVCSTHRLTNGEVVSIWVDNGPEIPGIQGLDCKPRVIVRRGNVPTRLETHVDELFDHIVAEYNKRNPDSPATVQDPPMEGGCAQLYVVTFGGKVTCVVKCPYFRPYDSLERVHGVLFASTKEKDFYEFSNKVPEGVPPSFLELLPLYISVSEFHENTTDVWTELEGGTRAVNPRAVWAAVSAHIKTLRSYGHIHCDIVPRNILLFPSGSPVVVDHGSVQRHDALKRSHEESGMIKACAHTFQSGVAVYPSLGFYAHVVAAFEGKRLGTAIQEAVRTPRPEVIQWIDFQMALITIALIVDVIQRRANGDIKGRHALSMPLGKGFLSLLLESLEGQDDDSSIHLFGHMQGVLNDRLGCTEEVHRITKHTIDVRPPGCAGTEDVEC